LPRRRRTARGWVDPPTRSVTTYTASGATRIIRAGEALEGDDVLHDFRLPLETLFAL
jgi:hypothetical protein